MTKIAFVGDLCLSGVKFLSYEQAQQHFAAIAAMFEPYELAIGNLECILSKTAFPGVKMNIPISQCPPLSSLGLDIYCMANNHIKDCGAEPIIEMQQFISDAGAHYVGAGKDKKQAYTPLVLRVRDITFGILNVTDASHYAATDNEAGVAALDEKQLQQAVMQLAEQVDAVILVIHSDLEFSNYPSLWRVNLSRKLAKYCAMIVHHHSHTLQGYEVVEGCVIAYSLGNFIFPVKESQYMQNKPGNIDEGMLMVASFVKQGTTVTASIDSLQPTRIGQFGFLRAVSDEECQKTLADIEKYSLALNDKAFLRTHHWRLCYAEFKRFLKGIYYTYCRDGFKASLRYISLHFKTDQHLNWFRSLITLGYK